MRERALRFGETATLVGVLTEPDPEVRVSCAPGVVFLNSGIIHHVGASRLYVQMARRLARDGLASLRFDFSGIGDSESRRDALRFEESAVVETREAMDYLSRVSGAGSFVLTGLCSGADMAYAVALTDERVVGLAKLDPFAYRTPRWYLRHYGPRVLQPQAWSNAVRSRVLHMSGRLTSSGEESGSSVFVAPEYRRVFPPRREIEDGLRTLSSRNVRLFVCFSGDEEAFNYREQYADSFRGVDFGNRLHVEYMPQADHTFTGIHHQVEIVERFGSWCAKSFGTSDSPALARTQSM